MAGRPILVAGAGIAGLTTALALARRGLATRVFERNAAPEAGGAGIQLSPNAARVLIGLGLGDALERVAGRPDALIVRSAASGREILRMPLGEVIAARHGAPYWVVHRGDLAGVLREAANRDPLIQLSDGSGVDAVEEGSSGIRALLGDETVEGDALIAADGVWSRLRGSAALFSGRIAMRARVPAAAADTETLANTGLWLGRAAHLVHYPIRGGREVNLVAIFEGAWTAERWDEPGSADEIAERFAGWPAAARRLLAAAPGWHRYALATVDPATRWANGRVALVGDAAHAMLPFAAQGGAMAIEDAAVLARHLADGNRPIAERLAAYEAERRPRALSVARTAARNGRLYHLRGPAALARDAALRLIGARGMARRLDWLYGWKDG